MSSAANDGTPTSIGLTCQQVRTLALASLIGVLEFYGFVIFVIFTADDVQAIQAVIIRQADRRRR